MRVCICVLVLSGTITPGFGVSVRLAGATGKDSSGDTEGRGGGHVSMITYGLSYF